MSNQVLIPREQVVFFVEESTPGTLEQASAGDALAVVGLQGVPLQVAEYTEGEEIANSRSVLAYARDAYGAGAYSLTTYLRPSGAAGTPPAEAALLEGLLGTETVTASTAVDYDPAMAVKQYSLWWQGNDNAVFFARGCTVNEARLSAADKGFITVEWSGECLQVGRSGETTLDGALLGGETTITVDHAERFTAGAPVTIGSSTGHVVTAVNYSAGTLTVDSAVVGAQSDAAAVVTALPTPSYLASTPAECRNGGLSIGGVNVKYRTFDLTVRNGVEYISDEVDASSDYPADFVPGARMVEGSAAIVLRSEDVGLWRKGEAGATEPVIFDLKPSRTGGTDAGATITATLAQALVSVTEVGEAGPAVGATLAIKARSSSAGEDEINLEYA